MGVAPPVRHGNSSLRGLGSSRVGWGCSRRGALPRWGSATPVSVCSCHGLPGGWRRVRRMGRACAHAPEPCRRSCSPLPCGVPLRRPRGGAGGQATAVVTTSLYYIVGGGCVPTNARQGCGWFHTLRLSSDGIPEGHPRHHPHRWRLPPAVWSAGTPLSSFGQPDGDRQPDPPSYCPTGRCRRLLVSVDIGGTAVKAGGSCHDTVPMWAAQETGPACARVNGQPHLRRCTSTVCCSLYYLYIFYVYQHSSQVPPPFTPSRMANDRGDQSTDESAGP